jgi:hypothetical protein
MCVALRISTLHSTRSPLPVRCTNLFLTIHQLVNLPYRHLHSLYNRKSLAIEPPPRNFGYVNYYWNQRILFGKGYTTELTEKIYLSSVFCRALDKIFVEYQNTLDITNIKMVNMVNKTTHRWQLCINFIQHSKY